MLEVQDLSASYGQHRALDKANLRVGRGEIVVILGANGAGKSTLLKAISGICEGQVTGSVTMNGHELVGLKPDRIVEQGIALVPEGRGIFGDLNVEENLTLGAYAPRARDAEADNLARVYTLFPKLHERRRQIARTMSGGEQQMVAIGRAMMSNPAILTLDEPSLGLSPLLCKELFQNLKTVRETGIGILLVEQNARASLAIADRGYLMENTHIIQEDSAEKLARDPAVQKAYLGGKTQTPVTAPVRTTPRPPPAGPSPTDIAASAMRAFIPPPPAIAPAPPSPTPIATAPPLARRAVPPVAPIVLPQSGRTHGIEIDALVAQARDISAEQKRKSAGLTQARAAGLTPPRPTPKTPLPDLNAKGDRLQEMLQEIEAAARHARRQTNRYSGPTGRKSD